MPAELKASVAAYCVERRAAGAPWSELSAELSVGETQLQKWTGSKRGSKLQRVRVVSSPGTAVRLSDFRICLGTRGRKLCGKQNRGCGPRSSFADN